MQFRLRMRWGVTRGVISLAATTFCLGLFFAPISEATPVTYKVNDHPDGGVAPTTYMLRLNGTDTFSADVTGTDLEFEFDPMSDTGQATLSGIIQHYSGNTKDSNGSPGGFYQIDATFKSVKFTDDTPANSAQRWWGTNDNDKLYDDSLADLFQNSNAVTNNDPTFNVDLDRIYFLTVEMTLTHDTGTDSYSGKTSWDEYPNGGTKPFFIQKNHRMAGHGEDVLAAAGWLEPTSTGWWPKRG